MEKRNSILQELHAVIKYGRDRAPIYFFSKKLSIHGPRSLYLAHCVFRFVRQNVTLLNSPSLSHLCVIDRFTSIAEAFLLHIDGENISSGK